MRPRIHEGALALVVIMAFALGCDSGSQSARDLRGSVSTDDVHHFAAAWTRWNSADSTCAAFESYWNAATPGLKAYARKFEVSHADLCRAIRRSPERYSALGAKLADLDSAAKQIRTVYDELAALHPLSNDPSVYFVVGNGIAAGTTTRGRHPIILIGMEMNQSVGGLPALVAHELVHTQQDYPLLGSMNGGPKFLRGSLLRHSIKEGSANFIASLVTGRADTNAWAEAHEAELWAQFRRDADSRDYSEWLYNGWNRKALGERPPDLGYWMGYRITKSYYENAADKRKAVSDILAIRDFNAFLAASGYAGGTRTRP